MDFFPTALTAFPQTNLDFTDRCMKLFNLIYFIRKISTQKIEIWLFEVQAVDYNSATDKACFFLNFNQGYSLQINIVDKIIWSKYKGLHRSYNICWDNNVLYKLDKVYIEKVWTKILSLWKEAVLYLARDWLSEPWTMKNQPRTLKNHENRPGTMNNQPGTLKNH